MGIIGRQAVRMQGNVATFCVLAKRIEVARAIRIREEHRLTVYGAALRAGVDRG